MRARRARRRRGRGKAGDDDGIDNVRDRHDGGAPDLERTPAEPVHHHDAHARAREGEDGVHAAEQQRRRRRDPDLLEDLRREVLDGGDARHLAGSLDHGGEDGAPELGPGADQVEVGLVLGGVFFGDLGADQRVFGDDVGVVDVAVGVELGEVVQALVGHVVVAEPAGGFGEEVDQAAEEEGGDDLDGEGDAPFFAVAGAGPSDIAAVANPGGEDLT